MNGSRINLFYECDYTEDKDTPVEFWSDLVKESLLETLANFMNYSSNERKELGLSEKTNDIQVGTKNNNKDKLSQLGDELYDFITNA